MDPNLTTIAMMNIDPISYSYNYATMAMPAPQKYPNEWNHNYSSVPMTYENAMIPYPMSTNQSMQYDTNNAWYPQHNMVQYPINQNNMNPNMAQWSQPSPTLSNQFQTQTYQMVQNNITSTDYPSNNVSNYTLNYTSPEAKIEEQLVLASASIPASNSTQDSSSVPVPASTPYVLANQSSGPNSYVSRYGYPKEMPKQMCYIPRLKCTVLPKDDSVPVFQCSVCKQEFLRKNSMLRHEKLHTGIKSFHCEYCKKSFFRKDILKRHLQSNRCKTLREKGIHCTM